MLFLSQLSTVSVLLDVPVIATGLLTLFGVDTSDGKGLGDFVGVARAGAIHH